ncbi:NAD(P)H-dependent oxidoreductase [Aridibaculum aurantiacum]|uniref:glutathione-regulated potassium-efflux system oxidoreductase KefF n=1 Tax=Aridibaculum aurantiacum TaxID=2810307 RepID=UPI001A96542E|nr:NAD(P)H-dependent oxidoreductase [Aridibaculum aurantiacum]
MAKILVQFAHPALEKSRIHARMIKYLQQVKGVFINDLYEEYPDFDIDVEREQALLLQHDIIILQHPFYWYSSPAIIKQWLDLVLEHGWAYGSNGLALTGKHMMNAVSCGGSRQAYQPGGINRLSVVDYLEPFHQTARLCKMHYLPPFVVHGTHKKADEEIEDDARSFADVVRKLQQGILPAAGLETTEYINDLLIPQSPTA